MSARELTQSDYKKNRAYKKVVVSAIRDLLYTFVTVMRLPWNFSTKVEFQNPLNWDGHELKRKYELFLFDIFIACSFIFFFCTDPCASRDAA